MFEKRALKNGTPVAVVVRHNVKTRLSGTCFRGRSLQFAGNFMRWASAEKLFRDALVMNELLTEIEALLMEQSLGTYSLTIAHNRTVGWESTAPLEKYAPDALEEFKLNGRSRGLRIKSSRTDLRAPKTRKLTVIFQTKIEDGLLVALVLSIYPGVDVDELNGDVTDREKRVFFDWSHPGEV